MDEQEEKTPPAQLKKDFQTAGITTGAKMGKYMGKNEIVGYEPFVDNLKELIRKKQYQVLKLINSETINLY